MSDRYMGNPCGFGFVTFSAETSPSAAASSRMASQKVGGGLRVVSVVEHLSVGETFRQASTGRLWEEVGLTVADKELVQIREAYLSKQEYREEGLQALLLSFMSVRDIARWLWLRWRSSWWNGGRSRVSWM